MIFNCSGIKKNLKKRNQNRLASLPSLAGLRLSDSRTLRLSDSQTLILSDSQTLRLTTRLDSESDSELRPRVRLRLRIRFRAEPESDSGPSLAGLADGGLEAQTWGGLLMISSIFKLGRELP